jgi:hypothetical protein
VIAAGHLLAAGREVGTYVTAYCGQTQPKLTVLSQDPGRVVLQLRLVVPTVTAAPGGQCESPQKPSTGRPEFVMSGEFTAELAAPLGRRRLIDSATGNDIPYTRDDKTARPTWLPADWHDASGVHPTYLATWEQVWKHGATEQLLLTQSYNTTAGLGGPANTTVGAASARVVQHGDEQTLKWWVGGTSYSLTNAHISACLPGLGVTESQAPQSCPVLQTGALLPRTDLLRIARSVKTR